MITVWKYRLWPQEVQELEVPEDATFIRVDTQHGNRLCLWALVDTDAFLQVRTIAIVGTGKPVPEGGIYLGSGQIAEGTFEWHVFEKPRQP